MRKINLSLVQKGRLLGYENYKSNVKLKSSTSWKLWNYFQQTRIWDFIRLSESYQQKSVDRISNPNLKEIILSRISNLESESFKMINANPDLESESRFLPISRTLPIVKALRVAPLDFHLGGQTLHLSAIESGWRLACNFYFLDRPIGTSVRPR